MTRPNDAATLVPSVTVLRPHSAAAIETELAARKAIGLTLVSLNSRVGLERTTFAIEMLSPVLAALSPNEHLSIDIAGTGKDNALTTSFGGSVQDKATEGGEMRPDFIVRTLENLARVQLPGFRMRRTAEVRVWPHARRIVPRGRALAIDTVADKPVGPSAVKAAADTLPLPPLGFAPERLMAAAQIVASWRTPLAISIRLRLVPLDAKLLRRFSDARRATERNDPATHLEAMRQMAEMVPDHAYLSGLIDEGQAIEVSLFAHGDHAIDDQTARVLCHALFATPPADDTAHPARDGLDPVTLYPRDFVLPRLITGLALTAAYAFQRPQALYEPSTEAGVILGHTREDQPVSISTRDRALHTFAIGATGTGKSTMLLNQMAEDMKAGKGLILIDPHGDLWEQAMKAVPPHRRKDLISGHLGDPKRTFTMNVLQGLGGDPLLERNATVNGLLRLFTRTFWAGIPEAFGPVFEQYFRNALLLLMEGMGPRATVLDVERIFQDEDFREEMLEKCETQSVKDFWNKTVDGITHHEWQLHNLNPYITSKLGPFTSNTMLRPVLGSPTSSLDLPAAIADGKIVLLNLAKGMVGEGSARLVGSLVAMRLVAAAQKQMQLPDAERKPFVAYLDEFQTYATEHIAEAIEETRKYKLSLVLACQSLGQIDGSARRSDVGRSIIANVANLVTFRLGVEDASILARWCAPDFTADDLMYLPNHWAVARLMVNGQALRPVEFRSSPPLVLD